MQLVMTGGRPNSSVAESLDASVIAPDGRVKILPTFQVPLSSGKRNVFAVGDIIDWPEQHTLVKAAGHAAVVVPNVLAVLSGQEAKKSYKTPPEMILITRGKVRASFCRLLRDTHHEMAERRAWVREHALGHHDGPVGGEEHEREDAIHGDGREVLRVDAPLTASSVFLL